MTTQQRSTKIQDAYRAVTTTPVPLDLFCETNQVSPATIKQVKRFDKTGLEGKVVIRKDKTLNTLTISRIFLETFQDDTAVEEIIQSTMDSTNETKIRQIS